jgi:hypothetical protein
MPKILPEPVGLLIAISESTELKKKSEEIHRYEFSFRKAK